jgi:hypothetical protein
MKSVTNSSRTPIFLSSHSTSLGDSATWRVNSGSLPCFLREDVLGHQVSGIFDTRLLLKGCPCSRDHGLAQRGVAACSFLLFHQKDVCPLFSRCERCDKTAPAAADDEDIRLHIPGNFLRAIHKSNEIVGASTVTLFVKLICLYLEKPENLIKRRFPKRHDATSLASFSAGRYIGKISRTSHSRLPGSRLLWRDLLQNQAFRCAC